MSMPRTCWQKCPSSISSSAKRIGRETTNRNTRYTPSEHMTFATVVLSTKNLGCLPKIKPSQKLKNNQQKKLKRMKLPKTKARTRKRIRTRKTSKARTREQRFKPNHRPANLLERRQWTKQLQLTHKLKIQKKKDGKKNFFKKVSSKN